MSADDWVLFRAARFFVMIIERFRVEGDAIRFLPFIMIELTIFFNTCSDSVRMNAYRCKAIVCRHQLTCNTLQPPRR